MATLCSNASVSRHVLDLPSAPAPVHVGDHGGGPPVVLLHGQPGAASMWAPVLPRLAAHVRVITPDRPGYGATGGRALGIAANAVVLGELLDALEMERATVVGHSWGGGVALALAAEQPDRVAGLVLVASVGTCSSVDATDRLLARRLVGPALTYAAFHAGRRVLPLPLTRQAVPGLRNLSDVALGELAGTLGDQLGRRSFVVEQRALVREIPALDASLSRVRAPTAVVIGERDFMVSSRVGRELAARIPDATCTVVPGAGHVLPAEAPDAVASAVLERVRCASTG